VLAVNVCTFMLMTALSSPQVSDPTMQQITQTLSVVILQAQTMQLVLVETVILSHSSQIILKSHIRHFIIYFNFWLVDGSLMAFQYLDSQIILFQDVKS